MNDDVSLTGWFDAAQVAAIFELDVTDVLRLRDAGVLVARLDGAACERFDPLAVEGLRRRLERSTETVNGLDPREAERVRHALAQGARDRMRALAEGRSYSTHPTIPPPASWAATERSAFDALVGQLRARAATAPIEAPRPPVVERPRLELVPAPPTDHDKH